MAEADVATLDPEKGWYGTVYVALTQKVFDFNDYHQKSPWRQKWADLAYDLGKDTTFRSKVLWSLATAALAVLVSILLSNLGLG